MKSGNRRNLRSVPEASVAFYSFLLHLVWEFIQVPAYADMAFVLAARHGLRAHHWMFGNMAPVPGVNDTEIENFVAYVRTVGARRRFRALTALYAVSAKPHYSA